MRILGSLARWTTVHLARFLATRVATPLLLAMTLGLAAGGALATGPLPRHQSPTTVVQTMPAVRTASCHKVEWGMSACLIPESWVVQDTTAYCRPAWRHPGMNDCFFWKQ